MLNIYTDGSLIKNQNTAYGGWAYIIEVRDSHGKLYGEVTDSGSLIGTTNMRMELLGIIRALQQVTGSQEVRLYTDSKVLKYQITEKLKVWETCKFNNGRLRDTDLWKQLAVLIHNHNVKVYHIQGHSGIEQNERCDEMARKAAEKRCFKLMDFGCQMYVNKSNADRERLTALAKEREKAALSEAQTELSGTQVAEIKAAEIEEEPEVVEKVTSSKNQFRQMYEEAVRRNNSVKAKKKERRQKKMEKRLNEYRSKKANKKEKVKAKVEVKATEEIIESDGTGLVEEIKEVVAVTEEANEVTEGAE